MCTRLMRDEKKKIHWRLENYRRQCLHSFIERGTEERKNGRNVELNQNHLLWNFSNIKWLLTKL